MKTVPILDTFAQVLRVQLGGQGCRIELRQRSTGLYLNLHADDKAIVQGVVCRNRVRVVRSAYLGFAGDLAFVDLQGNDDPSSPGLGSRFLLTYLEPADLNGAT